jgi:hypothetical protein
MMHTRLWIVSAIIAAIILILFVLSVPHTRDIPQPAPLAEATAPAPEVTLRDVFKKGTHTITGSVQAPTPCTTLSAEASLAGDASSTSAIVIAITMPKDTGICIQQIADLPFSVTVEAPEGVPVQVSVNGAAATVL